jgi:hypothetical protein
MSEPKEILTNLLATWDDLSTEAILTDLLVVAHQVKAEHKARSDPPSTLGISVAEVVGVEDKPV